MDFFFVSAVSEDKENYRRKLDGSDLIMRVVGVVLGWCRGGVGVVQGWCMGGVWVV